MHTKEKVIGKKNNRHGIALNIAFDLNVAIRWSYSFDVDSLSIDVKMW